MSVAVPRVRGSCAPSPLISTVASVILRGSLSGSESTPSVGSLSVMTLPVAVVSSGTLFVLLLAIGSVLTLNSSSR